METEVKRLYEALFLVDSVEAASDWEGVNENIKKSLDKIEAEIVSMRKWDERPLAYEIENKKRGTYILVYFNADGEKISVLERDVQLSERIMRVLILRGDHLTEEDLQKDTPAAIAEKAVEDHAKKKKEQEEKKEAEEKAKALEVVEAPVAVADTEDKVDDVVSENSEAGENVEDEKE